MYASNESSPPLGRHRCLGARSNAMRMVLYLVGLGGCLSTAIGCDSEGCDFGGVHYEQGESFKLDCNYCQSTNWREAKR